MLEEEELGWIGGLVRPLRTTGLRRVGGWVTTLTLALSLCLRVTWVPQTTRLPYREPEWTMANPFPFYNVRESWIYKSPTSFYCCGTLVL